MTNKAAEACTRIAAFDCHSDDLLRLEADSAALFESGQAKQYLDVLFDLFERFPDEDNEVFWGVMHGLEDLDDYESALLESIQRQPSSMGLIMVNRMLNADKPVVDDTSLLELLHRVASDTSIKEVIREYAQDFIKHQQQRTTDGS
ncbi:hypothetical protein LJ737_06120 [Hymenobacter sp. 15J16-1T3B]|uniref:hypothetical protein n=1 Tax=Hymenobacter sp. 15J16-1T3B TaxID=2886941 RepID=UPI001D114E38|nr:hypothetical protein [Hymenobacter sp. 15J16-1T3B]MCC3156803.1 hypothetical protein [Hymenobacter sp. 15J16-1T3B]